MPWPALVRSVRSGLSTVTSYAVRLDSGWSREIRPRKQRKQSSPNESRTQDARDFGLALSPRPANKHNDRSHKPFGILDEDLGAVETSSKQSSQERRESVTQPDPFDISGFDPTELAKLDKELLSEIFPEDMLEDDEDLFAELNLFQDTSEKMDWTDASGDNDTQMDVPVSRTVTAKTALADRPIQFAMRPRSAPRAWDASLARQQSRWPTIPQEETAADSKRPTLGGEKKMTGFGKMLKPRTGLKPR